MTAPTAPRARSIDWLRGGAALVMVQCHALVLLRPESRRGVAFAIAGFVDGLVAPAFYACAGFALAYTVCGAARAGRLAPRAARLLFRTAQVLAVSAAMSALWWPILREPQWLLRVDVLSCIGLSLLALLPLCALLARRPLVLAWGLAGVALAIVLGAPALSGVEGLAAHFVNVRAGSVFPLVPWGAHLAIGAAAGAWVASGRPAFAFWSATACTAAWLSLATWLGERAFPAHDPWCEPAGQLQRVALVALLGVALARLEARASMTPGPARRAVEWYGRSSLALYALHEVWLYTSRLGFCFNDQFGGRLGWTAYVGATLALLAVSTASVAAVDAVQALGLWLQARAKPALELAGNR